MIATLSSRSTALAVAAFFGSAGLPTAVYAQSTLPETIAGDTRRLTDAERQSILEANTVESAATARGELPGSGFGDRRVHGEVGVMVGTGGARAIYGTAEIPLGDRAAATVSFESSRFAYRR